MGVLESKAATFKWIDRYELIDTDNNDKLLKLMSRVGESEYIGKEYSCSGQKQIRQMQLAIDKKIMSPCPHLMKLVRVGIKTETLNCSQHTIFCLVFQKPDKTVKEESIFRKFRDERFSDDQIACILQSCVKSLTYLQEMGQFHSKISSSNIFINEDRTIVLGDPWLLREDNDFNQNMHGNSYPSPQKILYKNGFIKEPDQFLSDLFSLGLVLLQLYYLQHMDVVYQKGYKRVFQTKLIERINKIDSKQLKKKIRILLSHQPNKRSQILNELFLDGSKAEKFINLQKQTFKKQYIKNMLITSQVKTVKGVRRDYEPRDKTIINRMNTSRNPSDISSDTIIEQKEKRNTNINLIQSIRSQQITHPQPYYALYPRYSSNNVVDPQSRSTFTFHKNNEPFQFQEKDGKSISSIAKNQEDDSKDNIQLQLFQHSRKYGDQIVRIDKKSQIIKSSDIIESGIKYYRCDNPYIHRADYNSHVNRNDSKNSTFVLNSRVNDYLSL